ncbi:MAG TPA: phytanoyl-CoA dioxygenase [Acidimicrobiia bacterium]|nr:phytanoyl-CoA dioxygenase [Acidimicrobiia bacterium]
MAVLNDTEIEAFISDGFVCVREAIPAGIVSECQNEIWQLITESNPSIVRDDPETWTEPFIRIYGSDAPCMRAAANTERLTATFDQLVGVGNWKPRTGIGTFPIRFPERPDMNSQEARADGYHIDGSWLVPEKDRHDIELQKYPYGVNLSSDGRALLILFLFSDMETQADAPPIIKRGSHLDIARELADYEHEVVSGVRMVERLDLARYETVHATGKAGDVYLLHPFTVHRGQLCVGDHPRILAQPELPPAHTPAYNLHRTDEKYAPAEQAVLQGVQED